MVGETRDNGSSGSKQRRSFALGSRAGSVDQEVRPRGHRTQSGEDVVAFQVREIGQHVLDADSSSKTLSTV